MFLLHAARFAIPKWQFEITTSLRYLVSSTSHPHPTHKKGER